MPDPRPASPAGPDRITPNERGVRHAPRSGQGRFHPDRDPQGAPQSLGGGQDRGGHAGGRRPGLGLAGRLSSVEPAGRDAGSDRIRRDRPGPRGPLRRRHRLDRECPQHDRALRGGGADRPGRRHAGRDRQGRGRRFVRAGCRRRERLGAGAAARAARGPTRRRPRAKSKTAKKTGSSSSSAKSGSTGSASSGSSSSSSSGSSSSSSAPHRARRARRAAARPPHSRLRPPRPRAARPSRNPCCAASPTW